MVETMSDDEINKIIFGGWFVMTKEKELEWDVLIKELKNSGRYQQPVWGCTSAKRQATND